MRIIVHRRNTLRELKETSTKYGVEVDIRSFGKELILHHDPYVRGEFFRDWINSYDHGTLILNVKEAGLEERLISIMKKNNIKDYFFLDSSFPSLIDWSFYKKEPSFAVRVSEFESLETAFALKGRIQWIWLDYFTKFPLKKEEGLQLKEAGFLLCLVSPELQGFEAKKEIPKVQGILNQEGIQIDAICTKRPDLWEDGF